jgi:TonB family protein
MALPRHHRPRLAADAATAAAVTAALRAHGAAIAPQVAAPAPEVVNSALHVLAEDARYATSAGGAAIALEDGDGMVCRAAAGVLSPGLGWRLDTKTGFSGECVRSAQLLLCDDAEHDPRVDPDVCRQLGIRSILAAPILHAGRVAGIVELFSERPRAFTAQHAERLANLAAEAATVAFGEPMALSAPVTAPLAGIAQPWPGVRPAKAADPIPAATAAVAQPVVPAPAVAGSVTAPPSVAPPRAVSPASDATANAVRAEVKVPPEPVTRAAAAVLAPNQSETSALPARSEPAQAAVFPSTERTFATQTPKVTAATQPLPAPPVLPTWVAEDKSLYHLPLESPRLNRRIALLLALAAILVCGSVLWRYSRRTAIAGPAVTVSVATPEPAQAAVAERTPADTLPRTPLVPTKPATRTSRSSVLPPKVNAAMSDSGRASQPQALPTNDRKVESIDTGLSSAPQATPAVLAEIMNVPAARPDLPAVRVSQGATAPVLVRQVRPSYPLAAREMRLQGAVVFDGTVGEDGRVRNLHLVSGHPVLVSAARVAVSEWLYRPSQLNGAPHEAQTRITVNFVLPR